MTPEEKARRHNEKVLEKCKLGDLLEIPRTGYSHWAVYVGLGDNGCKNVVHVWRRYKDRKPGDRDLCCKNADGSKCDTTIMEQSFWSVVGNSQVKRHNSRSPFTPEEIVKRARSKLCKPYNYSLAKNNCEAFANWCRYGENISRQGDNAIRLGGTVMCMSLMVVVLTIVYLKIKHS
ncbi:phospholipase A and acyltransferase 2-like [Branchiostoma lanceolatum]|uniref:phospholipase A and acyltransferase 2-like n=1 Tax=Branchiostoma lanceolatum TaxID=7740 RepID=UPI0034520279